jgi:GDP-L-fucose synthase
MDSSRLQDMGWNAKVSLKEGLKIAYEDFLLKI